MNQKQKMPEPWEQKSATEDFKVKPVVSGFNVHDAMAMAGVQDVSEEEQQEAAEEAEQRGKQSRLLCCCGARGCGIGPFTRTEEY